MRMKMAMKLKANPDIFIAYYVDTSTNQSVYLWTEIAMEGSYVESCVIDLKL